MAAIAGFATTVLFVVLSVLPIITVERWVVFAIKIGSTVIAANMIGVMLYRRGRRRAADAQRVAVKVAGA